MVILVPGKLETSAIVLQSNDSKLTVECDGDLGADNGRSMCSVEYPVRILRFEDPYTGVLQSTVVVVHDLARKIA